MAITKKSIISKTSKKFKPSNHQCAGLHITPQAIHAVLLGTRSVNQIWLEKYAITPLPRHIINNSSLEEHDQFVPYLQQTMRQLGSHGNNITVAMPQNLVTLQIVQHNIHQTKLSLDEFAEFEIAQTAVLENSSYDYFVLPQSDQDSKTDILLASCHREDVAIRLNMLSTAGIVPKQMDVDVLATLNAVNTWINLRLPALAEHPLAICELGHHTTSALITHKSRLIYKQEINLGHEHLMQIIRRRYQLGENEAWAMMHALAKPVDFDDTVSVLFQNQLAQEIQRFLQFYHTSNSQSAEVQHILICGHPDGPSPQMAERIARQLNISTRQINPIDAVEANPSLNRHSLRNDGNLLTVAFGLAMRGL